jgi:hypothetical protein
VHPIVCGVKQQAQQLRPEQECGWVMAHKNAPAPEGNRLIIHDERSVYESHIKFDAAK